MTLHPIRWCARSERVLHIATSAKTQSYSLPRCRRWARWVWTARASMARPRLREWINCGCHRTTLPVYSPNLTRPERVTAAVGCLFVTPAAVQVGRLTWFALDPSRTGVERPARRRWFTPITPGPDLARAAQSGELLQPLRTGRICRCRHLVAADVTNRQGRGSTLAAISRERGASAPVNTARTPLGRPDPSADDSSSPDALSNCLRSRLGIGHRRPWRIVENLGVNPT